MSRDSESGASGSLQQIAAQHALSLRQMQRLFREVLALTPKQYEIQIRFRRFLALLKTGTRVTDAVYAAGFRSSSRMYEQLHRRAGMNAGTYRAGAAGELVMYATRSMDVGEVVIAQTLKGLCFAGFFDQRAQGIAALREEFPHATRVQVEPQQIEPIASAFERAVAGDYSQLQHLPLDVQGTAFQGQVWEAVRQVPVGMRVTYQELAASMRKPKHARAVARALSGNRIALAVPCHRVVPASNSSSGGYRWGAARKTILLDNES